jgi:16S rRNA (cytosine1402-N4)-methyltransferase
VSDATVHIPVLFNEVLNQLQPAAGGVFVDGTLGGGGHTRALAERVGPEGRVISVDLDNVAVQRASTLLSGLPVSVANASYADIPEILDEIGIPAVDGVLLDLGLSSDQLADAERGFSFLSEGELDMRFDREHGEPAWRMIARMSEEHLANVIYQYGEERFSRRIAKKIVEQRRSDPIRTALQLAELVRSCVPRSRGHNIDPATRTFQALRIAVNGELDALQSALRRLPDYLKPGGRLAIISFHSLEDRIVKEAFRDDERLSAITRKPIVASEDESNRNSRARSAKLRVAARVANS